MFKRGDQVIIGDGRGFKHWNSRDGMDNTIGKIGTVLEDKPDDSTYIHVGVKVVSGSVNWFYRPDQLYPVDGEE